MLPSPERTVRKSVGVCRRAGMNRAQSLETVVKVCDAVLSSVTGESIAMHEWIIRVRLVAITALGTDVDQTIREWRQ